MRKLIYIALCLGLSYADEAVSGEKPEETAFVNDKIDYNGVPYLLAGTYDLEKMNTDVHLPTIASLFTVNSLGSFYLVAHPLEFCHAIYVCPVPIFESPDKVKRVHIHKEICASAGAIKIFPWEYRILIHNGKKFDEFTYLSPITTFIQADSSGFKFYTEAKNVASKLYHDYMKAKPTRIDLDYNGKELIVLTNSKECHAMIQPTSGSQTYYQFFGPSTQTPESVSKLPKELHDGTQFVPSLYHPLPEGITKKFDIFPELKSLKFAEIAEQSCTAGAFGEVKPTLWHSHSAFAQRIVQQNVGGKAAKVQTFAVELSKCAWLRLWVSSLGATLDSYAQSKPEDYFDISFENSFIVPFHTDDAELTRLTPEMMTRFYVKVIQESQINLIEVGVGSSGTMGLLRYYTKNKVMSTKGGFSVFMLRAPKCDARFVNMNGNVMSYNENAAVNLFAFGECKYYQATK
ncbi:unnamed protein product [Caenorhabditis bovis]|uniref:Glycosyltransferase family 92 protein n=1 Tax=Caenorhabditis bovis TaxID=2654633 RepID=A0A8S1ELR6_9PELO|nr:unnamed protein product [Caenorhabditis bovis]